MASLQSRFRIEHFFSQDYLLSVITGIQYYVDESATMSILIIPHIFTEYEVFEKMNQIMDVVGKEIKV